MKPKKLITVLLGISFVQVFAQNPPATTPNNFSLKQCIEYAVKNQNSIQNATLDEAIAAAKVKEITALGLPQINGAVQFYSNDPLRRMFGVGNGSYNFLAGGVIPKGEVFAAPNLFQLPSGGDVGATVTQLIFSSSYIVGLQAANTYKELAAKSTQLSKIQVTEAVTKAYYLVQINEERIKLFDKNVARLDSLLFQTKALNKNGFVEKIDVDRLQVTYNNLVTERGKFNNLLAVGMMLLKYQMSMPLDDNLVLTEKISDFKVDNPPAMAAKANYNNRVEYSMLESRKKLQSLDLKNYRMGYLPRLAAFANVGYFSQSPKFDYFTKSNLWYNYGMYGLSMNLSIFDGLQNTHRIQGAKLNLEKTANDMENLQMAIDLQVRTSEISLKNSMATLESQSKNMELAAEVANITKIKYKEGVGTSLEVVSAETALLEAQTNYYNALYDALVSKIDVDKANGVLVK